MPDTSANYLIRAADAMREAKVSDKEFSVRLGKAHNFIGRHCNGINPNVRGVTDEQIREAVRATVRELRRRHDVLVAFLNSPDGVTE